MSESARDARLLRLLDLGTWAERSGSHQHRVLKCSIIGVLEARASWPGTAVDLVRRWLDDGAHDNGRMSATRGRHFGKPMIGDRRTSDAPGHSTGLAAGVY